MLIVNFFKLESYCLMSIEFLFCKMKSQMATRLIGGSLHKLCECLKNLNFYQQNQIMGQNYKQSFHQRDYMMANKQVNTCSASLAFREMPIKIDNWTT